MTTDLVLKMSEMLKEKLLVSAVEHDEGTLFIKKDHPATYAELEIDMKLVAVSENDVYFDTELELPERTVIKINKPVSMYISVAPAPNQAGIKANYYAVIHTIGEVQRSDLRKFINSVFFRAKELKKAEEKASVEDLKNQVVQKRAEEQKKMEELKAAEEAKAAEEKAQKGKK